MNGNFDSLKWKLTPTSEGNTLAVEMVIKESVKENRAFKKWALPFQQPLWPIEDSQVKQSSETARISNTALAGCHCNSNPHFVSPRVLRVRQFSHLWGLQALT